MTEAEWIAFFRRSEIPAFNAAMLEQPDADLPRLVFADWVEENCPHPPFVAALRRSIANPDTPEWVPNFSMVVKGHELRLWRGRIEVGVDFGDPEFDPEPDEFVKAAWESEWVGRLKLRGLDHLRNRGGVPRRDLGGIEFLDLFDGKGHEEENMASILAALRSTGHLAVMDLRFNRFNEVDLLRLANSAVLASLKDLRISAESLTQRGRDVLANSETLPEHIRSRFRRPS